MEQPAGFRRWLLAAFHICPGRSHKTPQDIFTIQPPDIGSVGGLGDTKLDFQSWFVVEFSYTKQQVMSQILVEKYSVTRNFDFQ